MPEVLVLGDSHARALDEGLKRAGWQTAAFSLSGALWHAGQVGYRPRGGLFGRRSVARHVTAFRSEHGGSDLIDGQVPVVASIGFHLGRLVPPFGFHDHVTTADEMAAEPGALYASQGFVTAYAQALRAPLITALTQIARRAPLVNVAPMLPRGRPGYPAFRNALVRLMRGAGLTVIDPETELFAGEVPLSLREDDGLHGTAEYGLAVVRHLEDRGLLPRA